jgi:cell division protein FtsZ
VQRTGTDNLPIMSHQPQQVPQQHQPQQPQQGTGQDYSQLATPSVWRNARTQAAAKVDALASNGMDEIEIPAFLRKQAD